MRRRKRDENEFDFIYVQESDIPLVMNYVYNLIDGGKTKYEPEDDWNDEAQEGLVGLINNMWTHSQNLVDGCVRCDLFDYLHDQMRSSTIKVHVNSLIA